MYLVDDLPFREIESVSSGTLPRVGRLWLVVPKPTCDKTSSGSISFVAGAMGLPLEPIDLS